MKRTFKNTFVIVVLAACIAVLYACDSGNKPNKEAFLQAQDSSAAPVAKISDEVIESVLQQIPSPLEISALLKDAGSEYDESILNNTDGVSNYNSNFKQALNLGVFGTDLGYTNIYEQNKDGLEYLSGIKDLAEELKIGQFFDLGTIGKLATNRKNLDSLLLITTQNFNAINRYLQEQNRANLSVLLLTGGWLEAMHITCQTYAKNPENVALKETIGEQKIILSNITLLLGFFKDSDPNIANLVEQFTTLEQAYESVEIITTYKESSYEIVDGVMIIKDNSSSEVKISDETVANLLGIIGNIRKSVIS